MFYDRLGSRANHLLSRANVDAAPRLIHGVIYGLPYAKRWTRKVRDRSADGQEMLVMCFHLLSDGPVPTRSQDYAPEVPLGIPLKTSRNQSILGKNQESHKKDKTATKTNRNKNKTQHEKQKTKKNNQKQKHQQNKKQKSQEKTNTEHKHNTTKQTRHKQKISKEKQDQRQNTTNTTRK